MLLKTQTAQKTAGKLLLLMFVCYFAGINFFGHKHVVNGVVIVHSHPFTPNEQHTHNNNSLNVIQSLSHFITKLVFTSIVILAFLEFIQQFVAIRKIVVLNIKIKQYVFLRPPPGLI